MPESPLVYITVLTYNGKADTIECLRSLQKISYTNAKTLVVDNASTDGTAEAIRSEFPWVELIVNERNLMFSGGNNVGIHHAIDCGASFVMLLNNDTTVHPEFVTHLVQATTDNPSIGVAGPKIYYYDDPQRIWFAGGRIEWWKGWISHIGIRDYDNGQHEVSRSIDYVSGCCMFIGRNVIEKVGMLDDRYFIYGEDADLCIRTSRAGYLLQYVPQAKIWHKLSVSTGGHLSWFKNWNKLKSQIRLMSRYAKPYHWVTIPFWLIVKIVQGYLSVKRAAAG